MQKRESIWVPMLSTSVQFMLADMAKDIEAASFWSGKPHGCIRGVRNSKEAAMQSFPDVPCE